MLRREFLTYVFASASALLLAASGQAKAFTHGACQNIVDLVTTYGGVGNGSTDNSSALNTFGAFARAQSCRVELTVPAGTFNFDSSTAFEFLFGIKNLLVVGSGAIFQNTNAGAGASPWVPSCFPLSGVAVGKLIQSTIIGANSVTLLTPSDNTTFSVGCSAVVMSEDIQISSSNFSVPPNCNKFDYVTVTAINASTGVLTVSPALASAHSANNIDGPTTKPCGKARIWMLDGTFGGVPFIWNISQNYNGVQINLASNTPTTYVSMTGHDQTWTGCNLTGVSPTNSYLIKIIGGQTSNVNEPDKLVTNFLMDGTAILDGIVFQSSSINNVTIQNCPVTGFLGSGTAKIVLLNNNVLDQYGEGIAGTPFGHNLSTTINGGTVASWPFRGEFASANKVTIDGATVTYANGIITLPKTLPALASWNVVPNVTRINLCTGASDFFTGDLGTAKVTGLTEDATNIYMAVNWGALLPAFANGNIRISRHGPFFANGVTGCKEIVNASAATAAGKFYWQQLIDSIDGNGPASGNWNDGSGLGYVGNLISVTVNVTRAATASGALWQLHSNALVTQSAMNGSVPCDIVIDATITGTRTFTQGTLTGKVGTDSVLLNSVAQTTLPIGMWVQQPFSWAFSGASGANALISVTFQYDSGVQFRMVT